MDPYRQAAETFVLLQRAIRQVEDHGSYLSLRDARITLCIAIESKQEERIREAVAEAVQALADN